MRLDLHPIDAIGFIGRRRYLRPLGIAPRSALRRMPLKTMIALAGRRMGVPSAGAPASRLTGTTVRENLLSGDVQFRTIEAAVLETGLEADGTFSDLTVEPQACGCEKTGDERPRWSNSWTISTGPTRLRRVF